MWFPSSGPDCVVDFWAMTRTSSPVVDVSRFLHSVRDGGYRSVNHALFELLDNSVQAGAGGIEVSFRSVGPELDDYGLWVSVTDDGAGMTPSEIGRALSFGGSSRFGDRGGIGRFGMGLPASSVSQARRADVYSWRRGGTPWTTYLDVDELMRESATELPRAARTDSLQRGSEAGTVVVWSRCDRLVGFRPATLRRRFAESAAQAYRYFLWDGLRIDVDGKPVEPTDPLMLRVQRGMPVAEPYGRVSSYEIKTGDTVAVVRVRFSELPVGRLYGTPNQQKAMLGVARRAGVSVVRARREIHYGWVLMGDKRKENYDDWWRCEVLFEPDADELFGLTYSKQGVNPTHVLEEVLGPDMEATARALNARVRRTFEALKRADIAGQSERIASSLDGLLPPMPRTRGRRALLEALRSEHPELRHILDGGCPARYAVRVARLPDTFIFDAVVVDGTLLLLLNSSHPFYTRVYRPLEEADAACADARVGIELLLLAWARADAGAAAGGPASRQAVSDVLATFLSGE